MVKRKICLFIFCLSVYLPTYQSIKRRIYLSTHQSVFIYPCKSLFLCLPILESTFLSVYSFIKEPLSDLSSVSFTCLRANTRERSPKTHYFAWFLINFDISRQHHGTGREYFNIWYLDWSYLSALKGRITCRKRAEWGNGYLTKGWGD